MCDSSCQQTQNGVKFDFQMKFDIEGQAKLTHKRQES